MTKGFNLENQMTKSFAGLLSIALTLIGLLFILIFKTNFKTIQYFFPAVLASIIYLSASKQTMKDKLINSVILILAPAFLLFAFWIINWYITRTFVS